MEEAKVYLDILGQRIKEILKKFQSSKGDEEEFEEEDEELVIQDSKGDVVEIIEPKKKRVQSIIKRFAVLIVILLVNFGYVFMGGFLFTSTETKYQIAARKNVHIFHRQYCSRFRPLYKYKGTAFTDILSQSVHNYTKGIYKFLHDQKWDGQPPGDQVEQWLFDAAVLYSIVVVTTIGYGDVTPRSRNGRLLTVIYAMLGVPIFLMFINVFGQKLGRGFKYMYYYFIEKRKKEVQKAARALILGEETPIQKKKMTLAEIKAEKTKKLRELLIPFHVSVILLISYILIGSMFFTIFEDDWKFFTSFYFSFISLTTIGFGDFVFGKCQGGGGCTNSAWKLGVSCFYIMLGLGVVSMSFNHIAQTFKMQFRDLGIKIGILKARLDDEEMAKRRDLDEAIAKSDYDNDEDKKLMFKF